RSAASLHPLIHSTPTVRSRINSVIPTRVTWLLFQHVGKKREKLRGKWALKRCLSLGPLTEQLHLIHFSLKLTIRFLRSRLIHLTTLLCFPIRVAQLDFRRVCGSRIKNP